MADSAIKACIDRSLPTELLGESMRRAVTENPLNAPVINARALPAGVIPQPPRAYLAGITGKLWQPGRVLRVRFLDGDPHLHARIPPFAQLWSRHANITLEFDDDPDAEIRISFQNQGSWSYLGTDALVIPPSQPTMNFGWLTRATADDEYARVVTHEFGHALGCIHEHQNPATDIPWDKEAVYRFYQGPPNYWSREQVDINLFTRYDAETTQFSEFDPASIMLYPIPNELTEGDFKVGWNKTLSPRDQEFIGALYPGARKATPILALDAPATTAAIGYFGEVDSYAFNILRPGPVRIETEGDTDVVLSLFGPDDPTRAVAIDNDSGSGHNARILRRLRPGTYTVRVRHFKPDRTGSYRIGVYSQARPADTQT